MPENHNRRRLLTGSAALRTIAFALFGYLVSYQVVKAEGTAQVMPSANNGTALFMQPATSSGPLFGAAAENRLYFRIADHTVEDLYFGLACYSRSTPSSGKATNGFYRIFDPTGALVAGPTAIPSTGTGFINSYTEAVAGPNVSGLNPTGYAPLSFDPTMNGEYYIEIYRSNTAGATLLTGTAGEMYSVFFDFTVSESNFSTKPGRVHCQKWSFITYDPLTVNFPVSINFSFEGDYYGYTADSSLIKVDFPNGFRPLGYVLAMNNYGVTNTGNFATDRVSVYTGTTSPAFLAGYPVFLQAPDPLMYARSAAATGPVIGATVTGCPGSYTIPFSIDKPGDVTILIDLNGTVGYQAGTTDVVFDMFALSAGTHNLNWNGLDGLGSPVVGGTNVAISAVLFRGRTNLPVYDAELNSNGFSVDAVSPSASNRRLYWDDTGLAIFGVCPPGATVTQQGTNNTTNGGTRQLNSLIEGVSGFAHPWNGSNPPSSPPALPGGQGSATVEACDDFGNARTINTWFWAAEYPSAIANRILPNCVVNQPPVANDDNGPSLTEDGPNGTVNIITNDTDPDGNPTAPVNGVGQFTVDLDPGTVGIQSTFTDAQGVWTLNTTTGEVTFDPANNYNGTAIIPYTLCDPSGACDNANITFVVTPVNDPPVANDDNGPALTEDGPNGTVNVITNDTDPDGNPTAPVNGVGQFTVDLDPGTVGIQTTFTDAQGVWTLNTATGDVTFDPANNYNGTAVIPYTLCDPSGACDNANITFVVTPVNDPPVANDDNGPGLVENGPNGTVNIITNDTDPDGNPTAPVNGVGQFTVDLDPGTAGIQTTFTDAQGVWTLNTATGEVTFDPATNYNGTAVIPYTLCDPSGACDNANITFVVIPVNDPPVANDDNGPSLTEDGPNGTVNVITNDTDPDGNPTAPVNGVGQFTVDLDPGTVGIQTTFTDAQGVWTLNTATGEVTFDPANNYNGTAVIPYTLCDPSGACDNANITFVVTPVNDPPVANDDNGPSLTEDGPNGTVNIISNDTDPDGNPTAPVNGVGQFTVDLDPGTVGIQSTFTDAQGVWTLNTATGEVTFDPANNYNGTAVIPYTLCDPSGACDNATITFVVTPVNDPPVANDDNGPSLTEDGTNGTVNIITNDTDPDGNPTAPVNGVGQFTVDLNPGTVGIQTTFTDAQGVWTLNTATGEVTFDPANNYNGTAVIPYTLCDPSGACDNANITFVVSPVNDPPLANDDNGPGLVENGPNGTVNIITNDTDPDGNPTAPVNGVGQFTLDLDPGTAGIQTTFTDAQGVWTLNTTTGEVTFDPANNYNGTAVIPYTLCDPSGACDNANITFVVTPVNDPPVANDDNGPSLIEDGPNGTVNVITNDTDPDGNPTAPVNGVGQFTVDLNPGTVGIQTTFTDAQGVWTLNTATGEVTFDPANNYNGTAVIPYTLCDPSGACDNANITFMVTPVNDPPVANDDNGPSLTEDGPNGTVNIITNDTDPDGNPTAPVNGVGQFTVDLDPGTAGIQTTFTDAQGVWTLNTTTGEVTFDPANNYNGTAVIPYTLCDPSGACDPANITFVVTPVNDPPVANDDNGPSLTEDGPNGTVNVITNDTDPDGNPTAPVNGVGQFTVDLDPGTVGIQTTFTDAQGVWTLNTATGDVTFDPANNYNGTAVIPYTLCDPSGACDNANITFVVTPVNDPPVANDDNGPSLTEDGSNGTVNVLTNDTDPDGNPTAPVNGVGQFTVDLDPGTVGIQTTFTDAQGVWTLNTTTGEVTFDPANNYNGTAVIPYTLCDPSGACDNANITFVVTPVNDPPVANDDNGPALTEDGPNGTVNIITNDTDPDGNPTAPVNGVGQFTVDLDPGTAGIQTTFTDAQGVWTLNTATGEVTFDPANNYNGTAVIPYTLCDPSGACDPANITFVVTPVNDPPVANDDNGPALSEDGPNGTVNVITNDTDPDGNPTAPVNGVGQFTVDLDPGTAGIQTTFTDAQGVWTLNTATGEVTFDPANNYNGTAVIPYTLCDPSGACDNANITFVVTPVNDPPVANDDNGPSLTEDGPNGTVNVLTNDTDPDGNPTAPVNGVGQFTVDLDPGTVGIQTTFTDAQGVWTLNTATGEVTFDPANNYNGTAVIPYTLCDPSGACDPANITFVVTPVNDPPVANDDNGPALTEDGPNGTVNVLTNDTDPDGNPTAPVNGVGQFTVDLDPGTAGIQTTFTDAQGIWTLNTATGEVTFDPANNFNGTAVIPYTLCDPSGACDPANITFMVTPVNDPPVANDDNGPSLTEDGPNGTVNIITNDTDPDGNPTAPVNGIGQFTVDLDPGTVGIQTTFTDAQGVWTLNTTTGEVTFDPANNYNGTAVIPYTLCDPSGACDPANITFVVTPVNDPPVANDDNGPSLTEDGPNGTANVITNDTDPDGNPTAPVNGVGQFTVDLDPGTAGIQTTFTHAQGVWTLNTATGEVTFDPANNYNGTAVIPYTLCDPSGACDPANITFVVTPVNDPPVANDDNGPALTEDGPNGTVNVITNDTDPDGNPTAPVNGLGQFTVDLDPGTVGIQTTFIDAQGVWTLNTATGEVTFDPANNYNGTAVIPYTLCDPSGACDNANITFVVTPVNDPPVANDDSVSIIEDDPGIGILVQINDTDDDLPLDSIVTTAISVNPVNGTATITPNGDIHYVPNGDFAGLDSLQYVLCDTAGPACDTAWVYIMVSPLNDPPVATNDSVTINEDNPGVVIVVIANDTDADLPNDSLIVSGIITLPGNGTATILPSGDIQYTPTGGWSGIDSLQYVVCDTAGPVCDTAWVFITVNPVNDAPVVLDDHDTTTINTPVVIDPLGNDGDPNDLGGSLDSTSVTILTPPANGTANVDPQTGQITYTPATGFCGIDSLQYEVCDTGTPLPALCGSAWVFITVTCPNDPPVAVNDSGSVPQGSPTGVDIQVLSNDSDPNGDAITVTAIPCQPANGSATVIGPGTINYIPNPGFSGLDSLCYVICDNGAPSQCDTAWVFIQVVPANQPPVANDDSTSTPTGTLVVIDVQGNDTDPNGNPLTTSLLCQPSNGAAWVADMDSIIYVPNSGFVGYDTLCYTVCDNGNPPLCDTAYVVIYVYGNNNPPVAMNDTIIIPTGTPGVIGVTFGDTDPDGDSIWVSAIPCSPTNGTATIVSGTTISYVPNTGFVGVDSFCYVICDNGVPSLCDTEWVYVTVTPEDVVIIPTGFSPNGDGDNDVFEVVGIDRFPNNEILVFNRWGNIVYQREGYLNEWNGIWDNNDQPLPDGTYFYVLDLGDGSKPRSGYIVMFR